MNLTRDHVVWAYRLFLGREPESEEIVTAKLQAWKSVADLRHDLVGSVEFRTNFGAVAAAPARTIVIKEFAKGLRLFLDLGDVHVGRNIINGAFEPAERAFALANVEPGQVAIDVGANMGFFSILMADRVGETGHVYSFEPMPQNAELLERSVQENGFEARITVDRAAVGDGGGHLELISAIGTNNSGGAYLRTGGAAVPSGHEAIVVPIVRLDDYPLRRPVSFIKLDAEGAELLALRGARELLRNDRPTVMAELNAPQLAAVSNASPSDLIADMGQLGYACRPIVRNGALENAIAEYARDEIINVAFVART